MRTTSPRRSRPVWLSVLASIVLVLLAAAPAGAWGNIVDLSDGYYYSYLEDNDSVVATPTSFFAIYSVQDDARLVGYTRSNLGYNAYGAPLDTRCGSTEGIAADGSLVVAACSAERLWNVWKRRLFTRRNETGHWEAAVELQGSSSPAGNGASVGVSGKLVVVAWNDYKTGVLYLRRSTDGGRTYKPAVRLGATTTPDYAYAYRGGQLNGHVQVAVQGTHVYVAWFRGSARTSKGRWPSGILLRRSSDSGASFSAVQTLTPGVQAPGQMSVVATASGLLLLHTTSQRQLRLERSTNGGGSFATIALTGAKEAEPQVDIAASGASVRAIWREGAKVYLRRSEDGGGTWSPREYTGVSRRKDIEIDPNVAIYHGLTAVAWDWAGIWEGLSGSYVHVITSP